MKNLAWNEANILACATCGEYWNAPVKDPTTLEPLPARPCLQCGAHCAVAIVCADCVDDARIESEVFDTDIDRERR